jgi:hypothetical protein
MTLRRTSDPNQALQDELKNKFGIEAKVYSARDFEEGVKEAMSDMQRLQSQFWDSIEKVPYEPPVWKRRYAQSVRESLSEVPVTATHLVVSAKVKDFRRIVEFQNLEYLFLGRANDKALELLKGLRRLQTLEMRLGSFTTLSSTTHLPLTDLILRHSVKLERIDDIEQFEGLHTLALDGMRRVRSISAVASLKNLIGLRIREGSVGGIPDRISIASILPIAVLKNLQMLELGRVEVLDRDLSPIAKLRNLKEIKVGAIHDLEHLAFLAAHFPVLHERWTKPLWETYACRRCGTFKARFLGPDKPHWCIKCNAKRISERLNLFLSLVEKYRNTRIIQE